MNLLTKKLEDKKIRLFGFEILRPEDKQPPVSFAPESKDDGAVNVSAIGGAYGVAYDYDGTIKTEAELVNKYRTMSLNPEIDAALDEISNEAIVSEEGKDTVELIIDENDDLGLPENFQKKIQEEFKYIKKLVEFHVKPYDIFKSWYRDGRLYYHIIVDKAKTSDGIQELRYLDPRKIRKIRENIRKKDVNSIGQTVTLIKGVKEYFIYNDHGLFTNNRAVASGAQQQNTTGIKIAKDSILHCTSGVSDASNKMMLSHLHKAIRPLNQLRALEDATVIYRITRAPERRIFYIDVGNLPKMKAEQYVKDIMTKYKNRLVYDANTGSIRDDRRFQTMLEDYWLPRREGGRGTEISTLPAGQNLGQMEDVQYFQRKLYISLNVPISRLEPERTYNVGRATEITRDEVKFAKFIDRLRLKFSELFLKALETQLILKQMITPEAWNEMKDHFRFKFLQDNYFAELKQSEILAERINRVRDMDEFTGKYFSCEWIRTDVLKQTEDEMKELDKQIKDEANNPQYQPPPEDLMGPPPDEMMPQPNGGGQPQTKPQPKPTKEDMFDEFENGDDLLIEDAVDNEIDRQLKVELVNMLSKENEKETD